MYKKIVLALLFVVSVFSLWAQNTVPASSEKKLDAVLKEIPYWDTLKEYDKSLHDKYLEQIKKVLSDNGTEQQIYQVLSIQGTEVTLKYLARSSDAAIINYYRGNVELMEYLKNIDAYFACKYLFSQYYGFPNFEKLKNSDVSKKLFDITKKHIKDIIITGLDDDAPYFNREDAKQALDYYYRILVTYEDINFRLIQSPGTATKLSEMDELVSSMIVFYKGIIDFPEETGANVFRYLTGF